MMRDGSGVAPLSSPNVVVRRPYLREAPTNEWIDEGHAGVREVSAVSRDDRQSVDEGLSLIHI